MLAEGVPQLIARALLQLALVVLAEQHRQPLEVGHRAEVGGRDAEFVESGPVVG